MESGGKEERPASIALLAHYSLRFTLPDNAGTKKRGHQAAFFCCNVNRRDYCAPIFTSVTSKTRVALGGKPFFGSAP